jgi:DNA polymerase
MDYAINARGVGVDLPTARAAVTMAETIKERAAGELTRLTAGAVQSVTAIEAMKEWVEGRLQIAVPSIGKDVVVAMLKRPGLPEDVRAVLTIRQETGKASVAKLLPIIETAGEGDRIYNLVQYHGAAPGRWTGRKVQVHNLVRDVPPAETVENIFKLVREQDADAIDMIYGSPMTMISRCMRGFFVPAKGKVFTVGDFSNVEGRGTAWFSGEDWKVQAYRAADAGTGPGLYELAYAKAFDVPVESIKDPSPERQMGKTAELAFGYQGGLGAWRKFDESIPDEKVLEMKRAWRAAHPQIVRTWYRLQDAAISAVLNPGETYTAGAPGRQVAFRVSGSFLWSRMPSGRLLCYPYPKILPGMYGDQLTYMTQPGTGDELVHDENNTSTWARVSTYGGALMQNTIEGICRDLLAHCMLIMKSFVVMHIHDEIVNEVPEADAERHRAGMEKVMRSLPEWAAGFPLFAKCRTQRRYGK